MDPYAEIKTLDGNVAFFRFLKGATAETFQNIFAEFQKLVNKPEITRMIVQVEMNDAWGKDIQGLWLETGKVAEQAGIKRWGVVTTETSKQMTIQFLVKGGKEGGRTYATFIGSTLDEVLAWIKQA